MIEAITSTLYSQVNVVLTTIKQEIISGQKVNSNSLQKCFSSDNNIFSIIEINF